MTILTIDHVGRQGDGVVFEKGKPVFVPFSLPGERVRVSGKGPRRVIEEVLAPAAARVVPKCQHFETCGGCQIQHASAEVYLAWKQALVTEPLKKAGIEHDLDPLISFDIGSRRKCVLNAKNSSEGVTLGFAEKANAQIVPISECVVTKPEITEQFENIKVLVSSLPHSKKPFRVSVLATQNGLDIDIEGTTTLKNSVKDILVRKALAAGFCRLSYDGEVLIEARKPQLQMGISMVTPPPGAFVQAVEAAEHHMAELVCNHLKSCKSVADFYCGIGTFALRLAEQSTVWAIEENDAALKSLDQAWRETGGKLKQVKTEKRNLDRRPGNFQELKKFDGAVFDPPRAGAEAQAIQLSKSNIRRIAAVSCNPVTLARDLSILIDGGYSIKRIVPIDQFKYTPHVEVVVLLEK